MTLITLIIQSYTAILVAIGAVALLVFALGLYLMFKPQREKSGSLASITPVQFNLDRTDKSLLPDTAHDVSEISGEDPLATQLDLARAYIETGKKQFAKIILTAVIREGSSTYQEEAQRLLSTI
jgi:FimV-like protein